MESVKYKSLYEKAVAEALEEGRYFEFTSEENHKILKELNSEYIPQPYSKYRTAVCLGRFQTPYLHEGHLHLINTAVKYPGITTLFIIIGYQPTVDARNPYSFEYRRTMIEDMYPKAMIGIIHDCDNDNELWSRNLDHMLDSCIEPVLFGSRDSFHAYYKGLYPYIEVPEIEGVSATKIRQQIQK